MHKSGQMNLIKLTKLFQKKKGMSSKQETSKPTRVGGEGGCALSEYDAELASGAPEEADQHRGPSRPEQLAVASIDGRGGDCRRGVIR